MACKGCGTSEYILFLTERNGNIIETFALIEIDCQCTSAKCGTGCKCDAKCNCPCKAQDNGKEGCCK